MPSNEQIAHDLAVAFVQAKIQSRSDFETISLQTCESALSDYRTAYFKLMELIQDGK